MKTIGIVCALLTLGILQNGLAQGTQTATPKLPPDTDYAVVDRGANHLVWEKTTYEMTSDGTVYPQKHRYTELATGLNYLQNGQWVESQEVIEPYSTGAIARQGQHQVIFANNLNSAGAIDEQTPDGKRLRSNIIGLIYCDKSTGNAVLIAQLQDSQGQLVSPNQVLYRNAFQGVNADVQYSYTRSGFEQDVILRDQLPTPESYGLDPDTTELEVCTEFLSPPDASVTGTETVESGLDPDENIDWGATRLGQGKAFSLGTQKFAAKVAKRYTTIEGRYFLLEKVLIRDIQPALSNLPQQSSNTRRLPNLASKKPYLPKTPQLRTAVRPIRLAMTDRTEPGYVLDYVTLNATYTNYTFQGDTTYYVTGPLNLYGTTVLEGGAVIKASLATNYVALNINGELTCKTGPYRPVVFTARDDNTVGESVSGSTGSPSGYYGRAALYFNQSVSGSAFDLHDVRISYFWNGVIKYANPSPLVGQVRNAQFCNIGTAALYGNPGDAGAFNVENVLVWKAGVAFSNSTFYVQNATLDKIGTLGGTNDSIAITNSLLVSVTNWGVGFTSVSNATNSSSSTVFQTVGAASHYLASGSSYRGIGTANVDTNMLTSFQQKTTWPPTVYSSLTLSVVTNYSAIVPRDTNAAPDLGYHYDVLDYVFGGVTSYSNMTFNAGTAIGWYEPSANFGISFYDNAVAAFNGTATVPCVVARYSSVQEGGNGSWTAKGSTGGIVAQSLSGGYSMSPDNAAQAIANFTHFYIVAGGPNHFRELNALIKVTLNNCEMTGSSMAGYWDYFYLTNSLFDRCSVGVVGGNAALMSMRNCTVHGGNLYVEYPGSSWPLWIQNCAFDNVNLSDVHGDSSITYADFNAYVSNQTTLPVTGGHDVTVTNFNWQPGWLGNYYLPPISQLIDKGNTNADQIGLSYFTTQTNQMPETNSIADIGYHYLSSLALSTTITRQPTNEIIAAGGTAVFDASVSGVGPFTYEWLFDGEGISLGSPGNPITTVAGNTVWNYAGDGGPATNASLAGPEGIAQDKFGNLFIAEYYNHVIRKVAPNGVITTVAGNNGLGGGYSGDGGAATNAMLNYPSWVVVDPAGNLIIADSGNQVIRKVDTNGIITTVAGNNGLGGGYSGDGGAATNAMLNTPFGIALDKWGNLFIADANNSLIRKVDTNGIITTVAGNTVWGYSGDGGAATNAELNNPPCVTVDGLGNIYIVDFVNELIRKVDTNGIISTVAGNYSFEGDYSGDGGVATNAGLNLNFPGGLAVDLAGNLYFSDGNNNVIREVDTNGIINTVVGDAGLGGVYAGAGGPATNASLTTPSGIILDSSGNLYLSDFGNDVVRKVTFSNFAGTISNGVLTLPNITTNMAGNYQVIVSNPFNSVTSSVVTLTVVVPPVITQQPVSQRIVASQNTSFMVTATGGVLSCQWYSNSVAMSGATNLGLIFTNVLTNYTANYFAIVTNLAGAATSSVVSLTVDALLADTDYDGRNNGQELADGTDPYNPVSVIGMQLGNWRFDNTNTWPGDVGQLPLLATNVTGIPSWDTNAVQIDSTNPAVLAYRDVETNGNANINLRNGTVCLWFKPDWSSANQGGTGPGSYGRLIELGSNNPVLVTNSWAVSITNGWWSLYLSADGNQLAFGSSTNGFGRVNLAAPASLVSTQWYQIALTYTPTNSVLYLNGQYVANGLGSVYFPNLAERSAGFRIGSDFQGANQARGTFETLDTFNYPLSASAINSNYLAAIRADKNGNGLPDLWEWNNFGCEGVDPAGDPTGDGISNLQKYQDNLDPHQFVATRLGYWQFNDAPNWLDTNGLAPLAANGLYPVSSWSGDAVRLTSDLTSQLGYPGVRTNGSAVAVCPAGTGSIRFWYKPEWSSYDGSQGTGPGSNIRLFEIGRDTTNAAYGLFALSVNSLGNNITFATEANGIQTNNLTGTITFNTNSWYQLVLTYTSTNSTLYLNGQPFITNGLGVTNLPSQAVLQAGFYFGSSWDGSSQANGEFDELETFNYPLSAAAIATNYANIMSVLAADGLPEVVANGLGLRLDAVDSTCDGLPDTWKLAHGINPNNPGPVTPQLIAQYVQDGPVGTTNAVTVAETNLINIYFSSYAANVHGAPITGGMVNNASSNDIWNFCTMQSDYTNNGVSLTDAAGNSVSAKLFAFIGPCTSPLIIPPTYNDWNWNSGTQTDYFGRLIATVLTYTNYYTNFTTNLDINLMAYNYWYESWINGDDEWIGNFSRSYELGCFSLTGISDPEWPSYIQYMTSIDNYFYSQLRDYYNSYVSFASYNRFPRSRVYGGLYFTWSYDVKENVTNAVHQITKYSEVLQGYLNNNPGLIQPTNPSPVILVNSFISPFVGINNNRYSLSNTDGAIWNYPGTTNWQTEADLALNGGTNASSGTVIKEMYPGAKRTLLLTGVPAGNYDVYLYYACASNAAPAVINGSGSIAGTGLAGARYWYANVPSIVMPAAVSVEDALTSSIPPWAVSGSSNYCIQIDVDSPNVSNSADDVRIIGLQIVGHTNAVITSAILQAKPGNESAYLMWRAPVAATNFNIYRSVGVSNSWSLLAATNVLKYQDYGLTPGTNYYYKVVGVEAGGTTEPASGVVGVIPFGCAPPLPPRIDYMSTLQIPVVNSAYGLFYQTLLTNSDAFDPQGWSMQFKVDSVPSGTLMINGQPFTGANCTIGTNDSVVWAPPVNPPPIGTPAFRVYVFDGVNRSVKTVDVQIKQHPQTHLLAWGYNGGNGGGYLGTGIIDSQRTQAEDSFASYESWSVQKVLANQDHWGVLPQDPRWQVNYSVDQANGDPPRAVLDLDGAISINKYEAGYWPMGYYITTSNKRLYYIGDGNAYAIGKPIVYATADIIDQPMIGPAHVYTWDYDPLESLYENKWNLLLTIAPSPVPFRDAQTQSPLTGVVTTKNGCFLKDDGSLWSTGLARKPFDGDYDGLGRIPQPEYDDYDCWDIGTFGLLPGRIQFDGNDTNGIAPGREVVEINTSQNTAGLARCKDGSLWWWGTLWEVYAHCDPNTGKDADIDFRPLHEDSSWDSSLNWMPKRMTNVESASSSPIMQIGSCGSHYAILRADGSISEFGYVPSKDPDFDEPGLHCYYSAFIFYSQDPVTVTNPPAGTVQISVGSHYGAALTSAGEVWVWGHWLGNLYLTPQKIASLQGIVKVAAGHQYLLALDKQGTVWGVGLNCTGVFGFNDGGQVYNNAVRIAGVENAVDVFTSDTWGPGYTVCPSQAFAIGTESQGKPVGLAAAPINQAVQLVWSNYPAASSYVIYRSLNENAGYVAIGTSTINSYTDASTALQNGQNYYYYVTAIVNGVETLQSWDVGATPYPAPGPVQNLTAIGSCNGFKLQWVPPTNALVSPIESYVVMQNGIQLAELFPDATNYYDYTGETNSPSTNYVVIARNSAGQATNTVTPYGYVPCLPAPYVATNSGWFTVANNGIGSDKATLVWAGPPTNTGAWLFQPTEFDTDVGTPYARGPETVSAFITALATPDDSVASWLWSQFTTGETNTLLSSPPLASAAVVNSNLAVILGAMNRILTNGVAVSNLDYIVHGVTNGTFADVTSHSGAKLRPETTNFFNTFPTGTNLVQLKRMLIDDYFNGQYFTRGANWGAGLTGFRIHYRTLQYINGHKLAMTYQQDVSIKNIKYDHNPSFSDDESVHSCVYEYSWMIPQGVVCWASVGALVDGQESYPSAELGPQRALSSFTWHSELRAVPGDHQVYLDWNDAVSISSYDVYYSTDPEATSHLDANYDTDFWTEWSPVPGGTNLTMNHCWHTGLTNNTTYYYTVLAHDDFLSGYQIDTYADATVVATNSLSQTNFSAYASAYNGMVLVEWKVPKTNLTDPDVINQTTWQFYVERKPGGAGDTNYQLIADSGFGLAYLDSDVVNGQPYTYRVTAFDTSFNRLQTVAATTNGVTQFTPNATNGLTLLPPVPGNGYVDLSWSPIRATRFSIKHSLNPNGPFDVVDNLDVQNAYQNAANTYRHYGLQNGVMHYYQIAAITPTGFEVDSDIKGVKPLATLAPLAPGGFHGGILSIQTTNYVSLSWSSVTGASRYEVFRQLQGSLTPLYAGNGHACMYTIPDGTPSDEPLTFAVRSVSVQGLASDLALTTVTNQVTPTTVGTTSPVVLQVGGALGSLTVTGPTNLILSAEVNVPGVQEVDFYSDGQLIGKASSAPYQMTWYHVPGTGDESNPPHALTAVALAQGSALITGGGVGTFTSDEFDLWVIVEPVLSAYQTSATDLQLPAPGLPIILSRSYTSRSTDNNGVLGIGWSADWNAGSVKLSEDMASSWTALYQVNLVYYYSISESNPHYATVTLPGGQSVGFVPQLSDNFGAFPMTSIPSEGDEIHFTFTNSAPNQGLLACDNTSMTLLTEANDYSEWTGSVDFGSSFDPGNFTYTAPDGTIYAFNQPAGDGLTWLLTKATDRNGNSLTYSYSGSTLLSISNSCGRRVTFDYEYDGPFVNVNVYDSVAPQGGSGAQAVLVYCVSNNLLTEVRQLVDRSGVYQSKVYAYGNDETGAPQNFNRLTDVYDARGVQTLHNDYTNSTGDLMVQVSPGRTNLFTFDSSTYNLLVTTATSIATNTAMVSSDASGAISGATIPISGTNACGTNATQCTYDNQGNLISQTDANGNTKTYMYDSQNRLIGQSDANGNTTSTQLNDYGQPTVSTDANGKTTSYSYDGNGNVTGMSDPSGTTTRNTYSAQITDDADSVSVGRLLATESQTVPFVHYTIVTKNYYSTSGSIIGDLTGTSQEWDDDNGAAQGPVVGTSYTYDANGNRLTEVKKRTVNGSTQSITSAYTYDAQNRVVMTVVTADGSDTMVPQTNTVTYNALGKQATNTDAAGRMTISLYDFNGNLIETAYPDGTVSRTSYDGFGRQEYVQDRTMTNSSGASTAPATHNTYDASGRVIRVDKYDAVTLTEFIAGSSDFTGLDGAQQQCKLVASSPGNRLTTTQTFYDAAGQVLYSVDARGVVTQNQYDGAGRRTAVLVYTDYNYYLDAVAGGTNAPNVSSANAFQSTSYTYDANGNQVTMTDAMGHKTTSVYDDANRVVEVDYPTANNGTVSRYTYYDGLGRKILETDEAGVSTAYTYDFRGLLLSVALAAGTPQQATTVFTYDELGNEVSQTDANGHTTTFHYDALGRRTGRTLPGGQSEGSYYDPLTGNLIYQTNFNGVVITNVYDVANRLTNSASVNGYAVSYGYNVTNGWRTNMVDASGTTVWRYNAVGQLTNKVVAWANGPVATLNYGYDALGSLTNLWSGTANGVANAYQYDLLGRLTNVLANGSAAAGYGFDSVGNLQTMRYGNGETNGYQYDAQNRLTNQVWKLNNTAVASFAYTLGPTGNRTALAETVATASRTYTWAYDYLYRLTGETIVNTGVTNFVNYGYDVVGNRTNRTSNISQLTNAISSYTANDWLASDSYDANGSTTATSGNSYQYDALNHLTNANNGTILMTYDGDGNRASKKVGGTTTYYLLDDRNPSGYVQVLEEWTVTSTATNLGRVYNYGLALISQRVPNTITNYFIYDGHGSTRALMDAGGNVVNTFAYDAYGTLIASNGLPQTAYLYCGQQFDSDLGMYLNRARYLNTGTGRFWTMDTFKGDNEDPLSLQKYPYCESNPINHVDPRGNDIGDFVLSAGFEMAITVAIQKTIQKAQVVADVAKVVVNIYVEPSGKPGTFNTTLVEKMLRSDLKRYVFVYGGVQVNLKDGGSPANLGWNNARSIYNCYVKWNGHLMDKDLAESSGGITTVDVDRYGAIYSAGGEQFWANVLAHESIWLNAGQNWDTSTIFSPGPDGDISSANVNVATSFKCESNIRMKLIRAFGL